MKHIYILACIRYLYIESYRCYWAIIVYRYDNWLCSFFLSKPVGGCDLVWRWRLARLPDYVVGTWTMLGPPIGADLLGYLVSHMGFSINGRYPKLSGWFKRFMWKTCSKRMIFFGYLKLWKLLYLVSWNLWFHTEHTTCVVGWCRVDLGHSSTASKTWGSEAMRLVPLEPTIRDISTYFLRLGYGDLSFSSYPLVN